MSATEQLEQAREDLEALLLEVLGSLIDADEVRPAWPDLAVTVPALIARLAIHDMQDGSYTFLELRTGTMVGRLMAARMMHVHELTPEDLLDVVAELGNIVAGNVKSLLRHPCQLSLPTAVDVGALDDPDDGVRVGATVLGHLVELLVRPAALVEIGSDIAWPGTTNDDVMEIQP